MILDTLSNVDLYSHLSPRLARALTHLATTDFTQVEAGSYEVEGKDIFVIVNDYETQTKEAGFLEVHQRYIDIQYMVRGEESFGYIPLAGQTPAKAYNEARDYTEFAYESHKNVVDFLPLKQGMFAIFFPTDMHQPSTILGDSPQQVRKIVIKVKV